MQSYVKVNIACAVLLLCVIAIALVAGPVFGVLLVLLWLVVTGALNYLVYTNSKDLTLRIEKSAKYGLFRDEINLLKRNYLAVLDWGSNTSEYDAESSITKAYNLISTQMDNTVESAIKYIKTYDYHTRPRPGYLLDLCNKSNQLVRRLHELQELILKVDDSTSDVDITYVDDLLDALREMHD